MPTPLQKYGAFQATYRIKIGSPYVIQGMQQALEDGYQRVVDCEANGGFLTAAPLVVNDRALRELPTRDPLIVILSLLRQAKEGHIPISTSVRQLPERYTYSDRLTSFPAEKSREILEFLSTGDPEMDRLKIAQAFGNLIPAVVSINRTDGLRIVYTTDEIVHIRPSGNAPELRCYAEADSPEQAQILNKQVMHILDSWR